MPHPRSEVEQSFRRYWSVGAVAERWEDWVRESFTEDVVYVERIYGTMHGRDAVEAWILPLMAKNPHIRAILDWYVIDGDRVVLGMQNRYDHPDGTSPPLDFAGLTVLEYAGDGRFCYEEDWWDLPAAKRCATAFHEALAIHGDAAVIETPDRRRARDPWLTAV